WLAWAARPTMSSGVCAGESVHIPDQGQGFCEPELDLGRAAENNPAANGQLFDSADRAHNQIERRSLLRIRERWHPQFADFEVAADRNHRIYRLADGVLHGLDSLRM